MLFSSVGGFLSLCLEETSNMARWAHDGLNMIGMAIFFLSYIVTNFGSCFCFDGKLLKMADVMTSSARNVRSGNFNL